MPAVDAGANRAVLQRQLGRRPRRPFRIAARCSYGYPTVIVSPSTLEDGERFPTFAWLTCPFLCEAASSAESSGAIADWDARVSADLGLQSALAVADDELRARRAAESGGEDSCGLAGVAGRQRGGVKCLHARIAAVLIGISDPIGEAILANVSPECSEGRCGKPENRR